MWGIDFGHLTDPPDNLAELRSSDLFAIGIDIDWQIEP